MSDFGEQASSGAGIPSQAESHNKENEFRIEPGNQLLTHDSKGVVASPNVESSKNVVDIKCKGVEDGLVQVRKVAENTFIRRISLTKSPSFKVPANSKWETLARSLESKGGAEELVLAMPNMYGPGTAAVVSACGSRLRSVTVTEASFTEAGGIMALMDALKNHTSLDSLAVHGTQFSLGSWYGGLESVVQTALSCQNLKTFTAPSGLDSSQLTLLFKGVRERQVLQSLTVAVSSGVYSISELAGCSSITHLDLSHSDLLQASALQVVADTVGSLPKIQCIHLSDCRLRPQSLVQIVQQAPACLTRWKIDCNSELCSGAFAPMGSHSQHDNRGCDMESRLSSLVELDLLGCGLEDSDLQLLQDVLEGQQAKAFRVINISCQPKCTSAALTKVAISALSHESIDSFVIDMASLVPEDIEKLMSIYLRHFTIARKSRPVRLWTCDKAPVWPAAHLQRVFPFGEPLADGTIPIIGKKNIRLGFFKNTPYVIPAQSPNAAIQKNDVFVCGAAVLKARDLCINSLLSSHASLIRKVVDLGAGAGVVTDLWPIIASFVLKYEQA